MDVGMWMLKIFETSIKEQNDTLARGSLAKECLSQLYYIDI